MSRSSTKRPVVALPTPADIQGWIVRGYHARDPDQCEHVRHIVATVENARTVRAHLRAATDGTSGVSQIQSASHWDSKPSATLNVGFTYSGLAALGVPNKMLAGFPTDFRMGSPERARKIGDIGKSDPEHWDEGMNDVDRVHLIWTIHGFSDADLERVTAELDTALGSAVSVVATYDGQALADNLVHFGYVDSISQPHVDGFLGPDPAPDAQPLSPAGAFFNGHESQFEGVFFDMPDPEIGGNATYNAFRVLEQDVFGFEEFLMSAGEQAGKDPEWIAAKLCGRWRNGNPLELAPDVMGDPMDRHVRNNYGYPDDDGSVCPIGSHMRRANPRDAPVVQRASNHTRRIIRRGTPYGPLIEPGQPRDDTPRGLLGNFLCGSLTAQFEGVMYDWLNLGLQHPDITGMNDPVLGANDVASSRFVIPMPGGEDDIVLSGFPRFVQTRASAYTFLPSLPGLRWLAAI